MTPIYKKVTNLVFGTSTLIDPLGMGNDFILGRVERYSDRLMASQNITNLDIFGKLLNNFNKYVFIRIFWEVVEGIKLYGKIILRPGSD